MVAYTTIGKKTLTRGLNPNRVDLSSDGNVRLQDLSETNAYELTVTHPLVNDSDATTLRAFYQTNKYNLLTITADDGLTYEAYFRNDYAMKVKRGAFQTLETKLVGNTV